MVWCVCVCVYRRFFQDNPLAIFGHSITIVDIVLAVVVSQSALLDYDIANHATVHKWYLALKATRSFRQSHADFFALAASLFKRSEAAVNSSNRTTTTFNTTASPSSSSSSSSLSPQSPTSPNSPSERRVDVGTNLASPPLRVPTPIPTTTTTTTATTATTTSQSSTNPILYWFALNVDSRFVLHFAHASSIPLRLVVVDAARGESQSPEYLAINPAGKIPYLVDNNTKLSHSDDIMRYLASKYHSPLYPPENPKDQAEIDVAIAELRQLLADDISKIMYATAVAGMMGRQLETEAVETATHKIAKALLTINEYVAHTHTPLSICP
jgi:glutathione S-transferase